jgi:FtsZ-interacting cell division protein ZipA
MTTSSIVLIVVIAVVALLLIATIAWVARNKRNQHRHVVAEKIREAAKDETLQVKQREALADETAAKARAAQAEADVKAAQASGLQQQAAAHRSEAATSRDELNQEFERADKMDPHSPATHGEKTPKPRIRLVEDPPPASNAHQRCPDRGGAANPRRPNLVGSSSIDHAAATTNELVPAVRPLRPTKDARAGHMRHRDSSTSRTI